MHEYGWTPDFTLDNVTLGQARLWTARIDERRRHDTVLNAHAMRVAFAASFNKDNQGAFDRFAALLMGEEPPAQPGEPEGVGRKLITDPRFREVDTTPNPHVAEALERARRERKEKSDASDAC